MATQKLQPTRALVVIPSENADIPNPNTYTTTGTNTFAISANLVDSSANFIANNVTVGDIVYNNTDGTAATVVSVVSSQSLQLNAAIFTATGKTYTIYAMSPQSGIGSEGSVLYIGTGGNIKVLTSGNDIVTFVNIQNGTFFPINVLKVFSVGTSALNIIALW
jgi:hypothetical protein